MSDRMTVHRDGKPIYDIVMEENYDRLGQEVASLSVRERRLCVVTDSTVAELYSDIVIRQLEPLCKEVNLFVFPAGEENKNLDTVRNLYEFLIQNHYDRNDMLVALGGGVVGDLCGFTAATYLRGIRFIQVPTTLLSQVDSSIGGKTGVDFDAYKNMVGAFHMPQLVYTAAASLLTLTEEQFACGMGEVIKHGLIMDAGYYEWLQEHREEILARDLSICEQMILISCRIKRDVVEQDPTEQGIRSLLNFGHTLGHAIEKQKAGELYHGECVSIGAAAAAYISMKRGYLTKDELQTVLDAFTSFKLPITVTGVDKEAALAATKSDKKMQGNQIRFILLKSLQ